MSTQPWAQAGGAENQAAVIRVTPSSASRVFLINACFPSFAFRSWVADLQQAARQLAQPWEEGGPPPVAGAETRSPAGGWGRM